MCIPEECKRRCMRYRNKSDTLVRRTAESLDGTRTRNLRNIRPGSTQHRRRDYKTGCILARTMRLRLVVPNLVRSIPCHNQSQCCCLDPSTCCPWYCWCRIWCTCERWFLRDYSRNYLSLQPTHNSCCCSSIVQMP